MLTTSPENLQLDIIPQTGIDRHSQADRLNTSIHTERDSIEISEIKRK